MFDLFLQIWGASFFLLNKLFLSLTERALLITSKRKWLVYSWVIYLLGLPAWVIVFISKSNWIAASVEAGVAPAMIAGLYRALNHKNGSPVWLDQLSKVAVFMGLALSLHDFGGITSIRQVLELGVAAGFLLGTYYLAKQETKLGYVWLIIGNISCASLMWAEEFLILMMQQLISLFFVLDALIINRKFQNSL